MQRMGDFLLVESPIYDMDAEHIPDSMPADEKGAARGARNEERCRSCEEHVEIEQGPVQ